MSRSQNSFIKKQREKKKAQKRKEKEERRKERMENNNKGGDLSTVATETAQAIIDNVIEQNKRIGTHGLPIIKRLYEDKKEEPKQ